MRWEKHGLVFEPKGLFSWQQHSALAPTPIVMGDKLRVYTGIRDAAGESRIGYVDLNGDKPSEILGVSEIPALDLGHRGCFDDFGVTPCCVVRHKNEFRLFYTGYHLERKVRFSLFGGMATSSDGNAFQRHSRTPISDRTPNFLFFNVVSCVIPELDSWRMYLLSGSSWLEAHNKEKPIYGLYTTTSKDGIHPDYENLVHIPLLGEDEFRVGKPNIWKDGAMWRMFFSASSKSVEYLLAYAESSDGIEWHRKPINLDRSSEGWDSEMICYGHHIQFKNKLYLFYNGNNFGEKGFGYAELLD